MFNIISRRLQKYSSVLKILALAGSLGGLIYLIVYTEPTVGKIIIAALLLAILIFSLLSIFISAGLSFLVAITITFLLFLKAVDLLTYTNLGLFTVFLILLGFYLYQRPKKIEDQPGRKMSRGLFPRGWVSGVGRRKLQ